MIRNMAHPANTGMSHISYHQSVIDHHHMIHDDVPLFPIDFYQPSPYTSPLWKIPVIYRQLDAKQTISPYIKASFRGLWDYGNGYL